MAGGDNASDAYQCTRCLTNQRPILLVSKALATITAYQRHTAAKAPQTLISVHGAAGINYQMPASSLQHP